MTDTNTNANQTSVQNNNTQPPASTPFVMPANPNDLGKYIQGLVDKVNRLEYIKRQYADIAGKMYKHQNTIMDSCKAINELAHLLDPALVLETQTQRGRAPKTSREDMQAVFGEFAMKLKEGTQVTTRMIQTAYPDISQPSVHRIIHRLADEVQGARLTQGDGTHAKTLRVFIE